MTTTLTDIYEREITVTSDGVFDFYVVSGLTVKFDAGTPWETVRRTLEAMPPAPELIEPIEETQEEFTI